jgi:hypothetical protein
MQSGHIESIDPLPSVLKVPPKNDQFLFRNRDIIEILNFLNDSHIRVL